MPSRPFFVLACIAVALAPAWLTAERGGHGPYIRISAEGEPFLAEVLRDNEEVSSEQLGSYLSRLTFRGTAKLPIKADDADSKRAVVRAKFELRLADRRQPLRIVFAMTFDELRLGQSKSEPGAWFLTKEGIELIEKAIPEKK